jgi:uncharacterized peroxidase-related enzyme
MVDLRIVTVESAPDAAREELRAVHSRYGFVPNLLGVMANAPPLLSAYLQLSESFRQTSLSPIEQQVVLLTTSVVNQCQYCVAAHSAMARMQGVADEIVSAIGADVPLADVRLEALRQLTKSMVLTRGWPGQAAIAEFGKVGFTASQTLEVILGVALKTLSNYVNHFADTPVDPQFAARPQSAKGQLSA